MDPNILENVQKRGGTFVALQGCLYEIQIIFLFMIRSCLNNVKFTLVNNADEFGNFDDLVAVCELEDGTELLVCLQSKHLKESDNKIDLNRFKGFIKKDNNKYSKPDKSFDLKKYREEILNSKISNYKDVNVKFIFYTTVEISETDAVIKWCNMNEDEKIDKGVKKDKIEEIEKRNKINKLLCLLLNSSANENCVRRFSDTGNEQILREIGHDAQFLEKICIFSNQCHENNLDSIIKEELENLLSNKNKDVIKKIYTQFIDILVDWYKNPDLIPFDNDAFLDYVWNFLLKERPYLSSEGNIYETLSKNYNDKNIAPLKKYILDNQIVIVKSVENSTVLPAIEAHKAVSDITNKCMKKYVFIKLQTQNFGQMLILFENIIDYLIIEVVSHCVENLESDLQILYKILVKKKWKRVVFLVSNSIKIPLENVICVEYVYKFNFSKLSTYTQKYLRSRNVRFQGHVMPFSKLVNKKEARRVLDYDTVEKLIKSETVIIGEELKRLPQEIEHCYIQRSFHCTNVVSSEIFDMESSSDVLLVSVTSEYHLRKYKRDFVHYKDIDENNKISGIFYHISYSEKRDKNVIKHFAAKLEGKNVHWLQEEENNLVWLDTKGSVENIQKYVQTCTFNEGIITQHGSSEDILLENNNQLHVLLDSAGKGKTTTLYKIAEQLKLKNKNCWVLHYDLNSTQMFDILSDMSKNVNIEAVDSKQLVVTYLLTNCTRFEQSVFNMLLEKSKIIFCFDGLDEISPRYEDIFIELVKKLNQSNAKQIWLTSREHMEKPLKNSFPVFPIKLLDISVEDRVNFCVKYYTFEVNNGITEKETDEQSKKPKIKQFSEALIKNLSSVNDSILEFMGIPLLTKMLASINLEQCKKYLSNTHEEANLPMSSENIFDLYQTFFENAIKRYLTEKESKDLKDPKLSLESKIKKYQKLHISIATRSLLPELYAKLISEQGEPDKLTSDQKTKLLGIGIITSLENDNAKFLHFTFAESMLAYAIIQEEKPLKLQIILDKVLYIYRWKVVRKFLNSSTLLAENISNIKYNPTAKNISDGKDTSLIIALEEGNRNIAQCLLQCLRGVNKADAKTWICKNTKRHDKPALCIAIDKGYKEEISLLLDYGANIEEERDGYGTPLIHAVSRGNLEIISLLLSRGANIHHRDRFYQTAILVAGEWSTPAVLDLLFAKGASLEDRDLGGESLLMHAAENKRYDMLVHVLGKVECDVNYKDPLGDTALHRAAIDAQCLNIKILLDHGADINSQNNDGETPLHLVLQSPWFQEGTTQQQLCAYLIKRGARTDITNNEGKTAWESAKRLTMSELNNLREWVQKDSEHVSIHDLEQQLENTKY